MTPPLMGNSNLQKNDWLYKLRTHTLGFCPPVISYQFVEHLEGGKVLVKSGDKDPSYTTLTPEDMKLTYSSEKLAWIKAAELYRGMVTICEEFAEKASN